MGVATRTPYQQGGGYGPSPWQNAIQGIHPGLPQQMGPQFSPQTAPQGQAPVFGPRQSLGATFQDFPRATTPMSPMQNALQAALQNRQHPGPPGLAGMMGKNAPGIFGGMFPGKGKAGKGANAFQGILRDMLMQLLGGQMGGQ